MGTTSRSTFSRFVPAANARTTARRGWGIWSYRSLIWNFAQRDLKARFKGTALGWIWSLVVPLMTLLTFTLVFSVIFRAEPPPLGNGEPGNFTVWLFGGLIAWNFLSGSIQTSIGSLLGIGPLLQKVYFPSHAPVLGSMGAILVQSLIETAIFGGILLLLANAGLSWLLVPAWLAIYFVFAASIAVSLAVLNVHYRDIAHLTGVALQLLFFLTPIIYTIELVPEDWNGIPLQQIVMLNPVAQFVGAFRLLTYGLEVPDAGAWLLLVSWALVTLGIAAVVYRRWGLDVGEAV